jgi:hypothetical protein
LRQNEPLFGMHNQNRAQYKARQSDPGVADLLAKKASSWNTLTKQLLVSRDGVKQKLLTGSSSSSSTTTQLLPTCCNEETCLKVSYKLLMVNPDPGYLWNARRELITFTQFHTELELTAAALQRNPKAYAAWFHRKWCVRYFLTSAAATAAASSNTDSNNSQQVLEKEMHLCSEFLNADERNFHCWNYRRFVVGAMASNMLLTSLACNTGNHDSSNPELPPRHSALNDSQLLDGSWDIFVNAMLSSTATTNNDQHPPSFRGLCLMGPQLTQTDSAARDREGHCNDSNNSTSVQNVMHGNCLSSKDETSTRLLALLRHEWLFTTQKIEQNFSNCSAFLYRSKLLPLWIKVIIISSDNNHKNNNNDSIKEFLLSEFQIVRNAIYTEPDDQTPWWYHRYLLDYCKLSAMAATKTSNNGMSIVYKDILMSEREAIQELLETEDGQCKWGWITLHAILLRLIEVTLNQNKMKKNINDTDEYSLPNLDGPICNLHLLQQEAEVCLQKLIEIDPDRILRYQDMLLELMQRHSCD